MPEEEIVDKKPVPYKLLAISLVLIVASLWIGINIGYSKARQVEAIAILSDKQSLPPENIDFAPLWKAWHVLEDKFVPATTTAAVTDQELLWGAISGLAGAYGDPYTVFFPPVESQAFEEDISGVFAGVGMEVGMRDGQLTVIAPLKDSPAEHAGIKSNDKVVEIDGTSTADLTVDEAVQRIRGDVGTMVTLTVSREEENELLTIEIVRDVINIPTIDAELRDDGVFVISLYNFSAPSSNLFYNALNDFSASDSNKLIIDLRNNPGGFLDSAVDIASWFLEDGKVVVIEDFGGEDLQQVHRSKGFGPLNKNFDIVVLVNEGSASASEILAGALKGHGVATVVGKTTFGKGSVQELIHITSDTSLKVTVARWLTPDGNSISDGGLAPDVEVDFTAEEFEAGIDPQLDKAVEILLGE